MSFMLLTKLGLSEESQNAAKIMLCKDINYQGNIGDSLPEGLSVESFEEIKNHPIAFRLCCHMYRLERLKDMDFWKNWPNGCGGGKKP
jgi:hypothetical protein